MNATTLVWRCLAVATVLLATSAAFAAAQPAPAPAPALAPAAAPSSLRFRADGKFTILMLTDLHFGEGAAKDANTSKLMDAVLAAEQPDLVVLAGDMVSGYACTMTAMQAAVMTASNSFPFEAGPGADTGVCPDGWFEGVWETVTAPLKAAGVPFAAILGNHDDEGDISDRRDILALDIATGEGLSLTQQGPEGITGASNYHLDVMSPNGSEVAGRVWFLDSMDRGCEGKAGAGCVGRDTVQWLEATAAELPPVPSLAFVHIPIQQFVEVWKNGTAVNGTAGEPSECQAVDTGLYAAAKKVGIGSIFSGHDHDNDYTGVLDGVRLGYGRKSGYGSYGPTEGLRGARVVQLQLGADSTVDSPTWIRLEDGGRVDQPAPTPVERADPAAKQDTCSATSTFCLLFPNAYSCVVEQEIIAAGPPSA